jgi:hypothetical protein
MRPAVQESDRIGKANDGPIFALTKATFNGNQVIRAFKKESYFQSELLALTHQDVLLSDLRTNIGCYYNWNTSLIKITVLAISFWVCMGLRNSTDAVTLVLIMQFLMQLEEKTARGLRFSN